MAGGRCDQCGVEEYMPYLCKFCKGRFCAAHRLPENHDCQGLDAYKERVRAEGRVFAPPQEARVTPRVATSARAGAQLASFWARVDGKMAYVMVGLCIAVFLLQILVAQTLGDRAMENIFVIKPDFVTHPWTIVTSIFAHQGLSHLFWNMIVLAFMGPVVERLIGSRRFTLLFLGSGAIAGIAQVLFEQAVHPTLDIGALGASGAIMGIMGTLVVLAPTMTVLVFLIVPAPFWALVAFYVLADVVGLISPSSTVANLAHLTGLVVGAAFGYYLRQKGLRAIVRRAPPPQRPFA